MFTTMKPDKIFLYFIIIISTLTFLTIIHNLRAPYFWLDEAGQFFISKGLNHHSDPLSIPKGVSAVIESNKYFNLDPGGFSILLHYWSMISDHHVWLRLLPFTFYIGVVMFFGYLSYLWTNNLVISILMGFIPVLTPVILAMGFELRPYSMEALGTVLCLVAVERLKQKITYTNLLLWSLLFSFLITSRYSEFIVVFVTSTYIFYLIFRKSASIRHKLVSLFVYSAPILITGVFIYFFALEAQNKNLEPVPYLEYFSINPRVIFEPLSIFFLCLIAILIILYMKRNKYQFINKYEPLIYITILVNLLFILSSFLGMYPWLPYCNRSISVILLFLLCLSAIIGELTIPLLNSIGIIKYYFITNLLILAIYLNKDQLLIRYYDDNLFIKTERIDFEKYHSIFVPIGESPSVRYLFEYGSLKSKKGSVYPKNFTFEKPFNPSMPPQIFPKSFDLKLTTPGKMDKWK